MKCVRREAGAHRPTASTPSLSPSSEPTPPRGRSRPDPRGGRARLALLLPALALLLGALGLFAAAPAHAQTTVWSATLTVDVDTAGTTFGCSFVGLGLDSCSSSSVLSDDDFTFEGVTYTIDRLDWSTIDRKLSIRFTGVSASAAKTALGSLTLDVDGTAFPLSNFRPLTRALEVPFRPNPPWADGTKVSLKLTAPASTSKPAKPTGLTATAGNAQVSLFWTNPNDASITKYQVLRRTGTTWGSWADIPNSAPGKANATSYTVTNLSNGTAYAFRIRAVNAAGNSPQSDATASVTPAAPGGSNGGGSNVGRLAGGKLVSNTRQPVSTQVAAFRDTAQSFTTGSNALGYLLTGVELLIQHTSTTAPAYTVGIHADSSGSPGGFIARLTNPSRLPSAVNGVARYRASGNGISLSANTTYWVVFDVSSTGTGTVARALTLSAAEDGGAAAGWSIGNGRRHRDHDGTTWFPSPHSMKMAVHGFVRAFTDPISDKDYKVGDTVRMGLPPVRGGTVRYSMDGLPPGLSFSRATHTVSGSPTSAALRSGESVSDYQVIHIATLGNVSARQTFTISIYHANAPARPTGLTVTGGAGQATLTWAASGDSSITRYHYRQQNVQEGRWSAWVGVPGGGGATRHVATGLSAGATYMFQVRAVNANGPSLPSVEQMAWPELVVVTPKLWRAAVQDDLLRLEYDRALDGQSELSPDDFRVLVYGVRRVVSGVTVSEKEVTLVLARAVGAGDGVTVDYTPGSGGKRLRGAGGGYAPGFSGQAVSNDTPSRQRQAALTASVSSAPAEHRGKGRFTVQIAFSEAVAGKAKAAAQTIQVTGGTLTRARGAGGADRWALDIRPSSHGPVTVTLPATADCAAAGAVCTADGRKLGSALTHTVQGPPGLSVADARATEGPGATLDFAVTLSRAASGEVTVRYATKNGTAKAGRDYTRTRGTLAFAAGETSKTVSVLVLDDAHDEGTETFTLRLSRAKGAAIADGEAVGTIENSDPLQKDWLARFGRAAAADAVAAVTARLETPRDAGSHVTLSGQRVDLSDTDGGAALEQALTGFARLLGGSCGPGPEPDTDGRPDRGAARDGAGAVACPAPRLTGRALLLGSSFRAVLGGGAGSQWTSWGQGASVSQFSSATPSLSLSGETATGSMGMDYEHGRLLTGFAMTHSLGEGTAQGSGKSYLMGSSVTTALPYARVALSERLSAWGLAGTGTGHLTLDLEGGAAERYGADLSMTLAAVGMRGDLVTPAQAGGFALALKADAFWVRTESESVSTPEAGNLAGARAEASRLRAVLDGSRSFALAGGAALTPSLELGVRHDGGDAETGTGTEIGAGLGYADPSRGLDMALRVHGLAAHAEDGYDEWGVSGSLRLVPGAAGRGLSASLTPSYGVDPGGSERLWTLPDASGLAANDNAALSGRLDAEAGYGIAMFGGGFTGTPNVGMGLSDTARELRLGWRLAPAGGGDFELNLDAARREAANDDAPEHRVGFGLTARW